MVLHDSEQMDMLNAFLADESCQVLATTVVDVGCRSIVMKLSGKKTENCMVCGSSLEYLTVPVDLTCVYCLKEEQVYIHCKAGHYVCEECHGKDVKQFIEEIALSTSLHDPLEIAEKIMTHPSLPMLGCEYASIACGALMAALRNGGLVLTDAQVMSALKRTNNQSISGYCGLTGVCGITVGIGAVFSVVLGAHCGDDRPSAVTTRVVARISDLVADAMGPSCCQRFVRDGLGGAVKLVREHLGVELPMNKDKILCTASHRHPHGCHGGRCPYYGGGDL